jgi:CRP-like cAMP-binding protein
MTKDLSRVSGPALRALPFFRPENAAVPRLNEQQRQRLLGIATRIDLKPRGFAYKEHAAAGAVFICGEGAIKSFRDLPSGRRRVVGFLFRGDIFGLAENGRYVNSTQATMPSMCYRLPLEQLVPIMLQDPGLEFNMMLKITHELREAQRHNILVCSRSAKVRLAACIKMLESSPLPVTSPGTIPVPMTRTDIADYLGLTIESVSRATRELTSAGVIKFSGPRAVRVLNREKFESLARVL